MSQSTNSIHILNNVLEMRRIRSGQFNIIYPSFSSDDENCGIIRELFPSFTNEKPFMTMNLLFYSINIKFSLKILIVMNIEMN